MSIANQSADFDTSTQRARQLLVDYPMLSEIEDPEWWQVISRAQVMDIPSGTVLMEQQMSCSQFAFMLQGEVRVYQHGEDGREVTLYHSCPGDVCVMSISSLLHSKPFRANAVTTTPVQLMVLSVDDFNEAMALSCIFRRWVLTSLTDSFCDMLETFHGTVFHRLEMRLACLLGQLFERNQTNTLTITHQQIAQELGCTREVVSRILKHLEKQGCIELRRGQIQVADGQKLPTSVS